MQQKHKIDQTELWNLCRNFFLLSGPSL